MEKSIRRKWFGRFLFRAAMGLLIPCVVWAEQVDLDEGVTLNYTVVNGSVHIGNTNAPFAAVSTDISGRLVLPETIEGLAVTDIGPFAFEGCANLTEVVLPASVTNIGESAFNGCTQLAGVNLPQGLVFLGTYAFQGCSSLRAIDFPFSLRYVGAGSFWGCKALKSVFIPGGVTIGALKSTTRKPSRTTTSTEGGVTTITTVMGEERVAYDGPGAFQECDALESVTFGEGSREVGATAFRRCRKLSTVILPDGLEIILPGAFSECPSLQEIQLPNSLKEIGEQWGYRTDITETRHEGGSTITGCTVFIVTNDTFNSEAGAFFRCTGLRRIQIPSSVEHIGDHTFAGCMNLLSIEFMGDSPKTYGWSVLQGTPHNLIVSVQNDSFGWYDPITLSALTTWQGRTVAYDGEILTSKPIDADAVATRFANLTSILQSTGVALTADERAAYVKWGMRLVQSCPESLPIYMDFLQQLGASLTSAESASLTAWAASAVSSEPTEGGTSDSSSPTASASGVVEAKLTVTNVVMHYVQEVETVPSVEALPADGLVAVVSEVRGSAAILVPCSWTNSYPRFAEMFGTDFVSALTKPTDKVGPNGTPLLVWQDYVAGTDPTDPASKFTATIDFVDGHPVVTWSPKVEDATFPRVYRIYGKVSLSDADWTELPKDKLDGYNFFKVTVEMAGK